MQLEDVVLVDVLRVRGDADRVTQQRKAGQGVIILQGKQKKVIQLNTFISADSKNKMLVT